ncbi:MAG: hypothetical protein QOK35_3134, partial [Pseudonocardiales bacterium]|nr:hypothetical protein [Pseudonocardiales bacterium]
MTLERPEPGSSADPVDPVDAVDLSAGPSIPRPTAALIGVVSVAAAVGAGHLAAALVAPAASPPLAVGGAVVRLTPLPLVEFATSTFGTADKLVLLTGVGVLLVVVAALAGLASRRRAGPAVAVVVALGVVAGAAARTAPAFAQLDLAPPLAATIAGVVAVRWLHSRALRAPAHDRAGDPGAPRDPGGDPEDDAVVTRRRVLGGSAAALGIVGAAALASGAAGQLLGRGVGDSRAEVERRLAAARVTPAPPVPPGADLAAFGAPPVVTPNADFYRIDTALSVPQVSRGDWRLRIHGMVDREVTLSFDDLQRFELVEQIVTLTCVSNPVGGDLISNAKWTGYRVRDLLAEVGIHADADMVLSTSVDGFTAGTPVEALTDQRDSLLAIGMNGAPLPTEHGYPARLVVPGLYGYVSATKWLADLELTRFDHAEAYWTKLG